MRNDKLIIVLVGITLFSVSCFSGCDRRQAEVKREKEITRHIIEEVWNKGDLSQVDKYYAPGYVYHGTRSSLPDIKGTDALKKFIEREHLNYPDYHIVIDEITVGDGRITVQGVFTGTRGGVVHRDASRGKKAMFTFCTVIRKENGKIFEQWMYADYLDGMRGMGYKILPPLSESTFAMVTTAQLKPGKIEDLVKLEKELSVPLLKSYKEFRGFYFMGDEKTGKVCGISIWEGGKDFWAAGMKDEKVQAFFKEFADKTRDFFTAKPVREGYTVMVQE